MIARERAAVRRRETIAYGAIGVCDVQYTAYDVQYALEETMGHAMQVRGNDVGGVSTDAQSKLRPVLERK